MFEDLLSRRFLDNSAEAHISFIATVLAFALLGRVLVALFRRSSAGRAAASAASLNDLLSQALRGPVTGVMSLVGARVAVIFYGEATLVRDAVIEAVSVGSVFVVCWFAVGLWRVLVERVLVPLSRQEPPTLEPMLIPVLRRVVSVSIWLFAVVIAAGNMGYNVLTVLTGLGIGGLAVALAAKDTLSPAVGGIAIFLTRPFAVGHYIEVEGGGGVVQEIGLRATLLRRASSMITVPNDKLINGAIRNRYRSGASSVSVTFGAPFDLPAEELDALCTAIAGALAQARGVDPYRCSCKLSGITEAGFTLKAKYWVFTKDSYTDAMHDCMLVVKRTFDARGVPLLYPTQVQLVRPMPLRESDSA